MWRRACVLLLACVVADTLAGVAAGPDRDEVSAAGSKVIGGRDAQDGEFPYQVSLQRALWGGGGSTHECGAAIVDELHVITAAHCAHAPFVDEMVVVAGVRDISAADDERRLDVAVAQKYLHPEYDFLYYFNDIALLRLQQPLPLEGRAGGARVGAVPLRKTPLAAPAACVVSGWGNMRQGSNYSYPSVLQALDLPFVDYAVCQELYENYPRGFFVPGMLCAGFMEGQKDSCDGDSGGPLVCQGQLTGVVSWGEDCAQPGFPGIYADVAYYRDWLEATLRRSRADAAAREPQGDAPRSSLSHQQ